MLVILIFWVPIAVIDPIFGIIIVAFIGPIGAYLVAAHKMSGKIATTEAAQLWEESKAIREWSAARIDKCDEEILRLNTELAIAKNRIDELERENRKLNERLAMREDRYEQ